ncbi:MAG: carboxypeptidase-like regulatory domain-containing protein, partial [Nitrosopumilaceae archaeon]|nr:carboxypeptidase-like regulatory domain-containing protein [Nitrosopumilaceae archaeon]
MLELKPLLVLLVVVSMASAIPFAESVLWDLLITFHIQNDPLLEGQDPLIAGHVNDHAGKPVVNATIQIRSGPNTVYTTTNESGEFSYEFAGLDLIPGEHVVNVMATSLENKIGLASQNFQVKGELSVS